MAAPAREQQQQQQPQQVVELVDGSAMAPIIDPSLTMTSLYVGDLNPDVNEAMLFDRFSPSGTIASIRVCRDHVTRRSLRYAYVNFQTHEDAKRALEDLNFELLKDKAMRISWSNRDPSVRRNNDANIFIKNLERSIDSKHLLDTFQSFGDVVSCKVATDDRGESKGYGFVHFANPQDATRALETVNGKAINGQTVTIAKFLPKRERQEQQGGRAQQFTNVYVKNLPLTLTEEGLLAVFSKSGKVTSHFIKRDENGASKGFGFVNFENPEDAVKAVDSLNNSELEGQKLFVSRAQKRNERRLMLEEQHENLRKEREEKTRGVNLYIKNLDENIDDEALRNAFAKFGTITSVKVMRDERSKASKGFGFVCFSAPEEATKAMTEMSSKIIAVKPLYIAPAQRKAEREALMSQRHQIPFARGQMMPPFQQMGMYPPMYPYRAGQIPRGNRQYQQMMPPMGPMGGPGLGGRMVPQQGVPQGLPLAPGQVQQLPQMAPQGLPTMGRGGRRQPGGARGGAVQQQQQRGMRQPLQQQQQQQQQFQQQQLQQQRMMAAPQMGGMEDLANLVDAPPEKKKQMLGERLYPLIHQTYGEQAGKITGMLLAMEDSELLHLLEDKDALKEKAAEAQKVLEEHMRQKEQ